MVRKWLGFTIFDIIFPTFLDRRKMLYYNLYNKVEVYGFSPNASEKSSPTLKKRHQRNFLRVLQPHFSKNGCGNAAQGKRDVTATQNSQKNKRKENNGFHSEKVAILPKFRSVKRQRKRRGRGPRAKMRQFAQVWGKVAPLGKAAKWGINDKNIA